MRKILPLSMIIIAASLLAGCSTTLNPQYQPDITMDHNIVRTTKAIAVEVTDSRAGDPTLIDTLHATAYGPAGVPIDTYHDYKLSQPVANFFSDDLKKALLQAGYQVSDQGKYLLSTDINKIKVVVESTGFFSNPIIHVKLDAQVSARLAKTDEPIWKTTMDIDGAYHAKGFDDGKTAITNALDDAINKLADQIVNNAQLNQLL